MCSLASLLQDHSVAINCNHAPRRSNELGSEQRNIAHSAAEVEHFHAGLDSRGHKELPGPFLEDGCLILQAVLFLHALPKT